MARSLHSPLAAMLREAHAAATESAATGEHTALENQASSRGRRNGERIATEL
jgi:hypothetical protein